MGYNSRAKSSSEWHGDQQQTPLVEKDVLEINEGPVWWSIRNRERRRKQEEDFHRESSQTITGNVVNNSNSIGRSKSQWQTKRKTAQLIPRAKLKTSASSISSYKATAKRPSFNHRTKNANKKKLLSSASDRRKEEEEEGEESADKEESEREVDKLFGNDMRSEMSCATVPVTAVNQTKPQMITVKETLSPASHLYSEKIRIARDAAIFEIKRENCCTAESTRFSSRYEIYNSTTRPFGKSYRELTLTSGSSTSCGCESGSTSSCCSETTTYVTCNSDIDSVQMTAFQRIEEIQPPREHASHTLDEEKEEPKSPEEHSETTPCPERSSIKPNVKSIVEIDTWRSNSSKEALAQPLKSPKLLTQMIQNYEKNGPNLSYNVPTSSTKNSFAEEEFSYEPDSDLSTSKIVTRCRSMLNLERENKPMVVRKKVIKATSEISLHDPNLDKTAAKSTPAIESIECEPKKIVNISIRSSKKPPKIKLEDKFEKQMNDLLTARRNRLLSSSVIDEALANDVIVVEPTQPAPVERGQSTTFTRGDCRVTGELMKNNSTSGTFEQRYGDLCTLPRTAKSHRSQLQRHFYYHAGRPRSMLLKDDELPDPDKVKSARELFENVLKLKPQSVGKFNTIGWRPTHEVKITEAVQGQRRGEHKKVRRSVTLETDQPTITGKWLDDRSQSSGVGSDVSGETDTDSNHRGADSSSGDDCKEEAVFSSEDDESNPTPSNNASLGQPVSPDILQKIRAFGTCVTYYGGKVIASSEGHACSPMTMTIMDEIRRNTIQQQLKDGKTDSLDEGCFMMKFELRKSTSCDSRLELSGGGVDKFHSEKQHQPIEKCEARGTFNKHQTDSAVIAEEKEDETKPEDIIITKIEKTYPDMEFEEFQVLDDIVTECEKQ